MRERLASLIHHPLMRLTLRAFATSVLLVVFTAWGLTRLGWMEYTVQSSLGQVEFTTSKSGTVLRYWSIQPRFNRLGITRRVLEYPIHHAEWRDQLDSEMHMIFKLPGLCIWTAPAGMNAWHNRYVAYLNHLWIVVTAVAINVVVHRLTREYESLNRNLSATQAIVTVPLP